MAITYTWEITGMKVRDEVNSEGVTLTNAVVQTYWKKIGTDSANTEHVGTFSGATPFTASDVPEGEFIEFESLTEETVLGWIQDVVVGSYEEHVNAQIQKQIDAIVNPITEPTLPWAKNTENTA